MGRLGESEGGVEHMKKDSINLFPTRRSTLLFHMRTNIIERCTMFHTVEKSSKKSHNMTKKLISERSEHSAAGLAQAAEGGVSASVIKI